MIVRPCAWKKIKWLSKIQAFPPDGKALHGRRPHTVEELLSKLAEKLASGELCAKTPGVPASPPPGVPGQRKTILLTSLPSRKIDLIGRDEELRLLEQRLQDSGPVLLVQGLGGIGKTEVCKRFFLDHYRQYAFAGWIDCVASIKESLVNACSVCPEQMNLEDMGTG